jgi:hypothetical protein
MKSNSKNRLSPALSPQGRENHYRTFSSGSENSNKEIEMKEGINYKYKDEM